MFQKMILAGQLGGDPELKYLEDGKAVCNFSIAVDDSYSEETTWFRVTTWGKTAENCNQYLSTGRQVLVDGRLRVGGPRVYTRNDGTAGAGYEVTASSVTFMGKSDGGSNPADDFNQDAFDHKDSSSSVATDDIPF